MQTAFLDNIKAEEHKVVSKLSQVFEENLPSALCCQSQHERRWRIRGRELSMKGWEGEERKLDCEKQDRIGIM